MEYLKIYGVLVEITDDNAQRIARNVTTVNRIELLQEYDGAVFVPNGHVMVDGDCFQYITDGRPDGGKALAVYTALVGIAPVAL